MASILLLGATGLVGSSCLELLLADSLFERIVVLTRTPLPTRGITGGGKLEEHVIDFSRLGDFTDNMKADQVVCALGTTIKKAGSKTRFREVDFVYPLRVAALAHARGASHYLLVSAMGANPDSPFFYNRVKGQLEQALCALPYQAVTIVRPSLLLGDRAEFRLGEEAAKRLGFLLPRKYAPVKASDVARALVDAARRARPGVEIIESGDIPKRAHGRMDGRVT